MSDNIEKDHYNQNLCEVSSSLNRVKNKVQIFCLKICLNMEVGKKTTLPTTYLIVLKMNFIFKKKLSIQISKS